MNKIPFYALNCNQFVSVVQQICQVLQRERERGRERERERERERTERENREREREARKDPSRDKE